MSCSHLPPFSLVAEQALLGCLIIGGREAFAEAGKLSPDLFYQADHAILFRELLELNNSYPIVDAIVLRARLIERGLLEEIGGIAYLAEILSSCKSPVATEALADVVREQHNRRLEWTGNPFA